jgi:hypothetical protein
VKNFEIILTKLSWALRGTVPVPVEVEVGFAATTTPLYPYSKPVMAPSLFLLLIHYPWKERVK